MTTEMLIALADSYSAHRGLKLSTVSTYAAGDGKFFNRLASGAGCTLRKAADLLNWFDANWPCDLDWPRDVPRPPKSKKEAA